MANLPETEQYEPGIYQLETTDPVVAGPDGISNRQAKELANRTAFLRQQIDQLKAEIEQLEVNSISGLQTELDTLKAADLEDITIDNVLELRSELNALRNTKTQEVDVSESSAEFNTNVFNPTRTRLIVEEPGKYLILYHFRTYIRSGEINLRFWNSSLTINDAHAIAFFGLNADETGISNHDTTVTGFAIRDLSAGDILRTNVDPNSITVSTVTMFYRSGITILKIGEF